MEIKQIKINTLKILIIFAFFINLSDLCDPTICSPRGGICLEGNICKCRHCFTSLKDYANESNLYWYTKDNRECNYEQYSAITAALLEFFFPIGAGHFYMGQILFGFGKMFLAYIMICGVYAISACYYIYKFKHNSEDRGGIYTRAVELVPLPEGRPREMLLYTSNALVAISEDTVKIKVIALFSQIFFVILHFIDVLLLYSAYYRDSNNIKLC